MTAVLEAVRRATPDDLLAAETGTDLSYELVDGELREKLMGMPANRVAVRITALLERFGELTGAGWVFGSDTAYRCFPDDPDLVRKPDVSFIARDRLTGDEEYSFVPIAPDLAVEVVSPTNTVYEIDRKMDEFFGAGTREVWVVNPGAKTVSTCRPDGTARRLRGSDSLASETVLPGFACRVDEFFRRPVAAAKN